MERIEVERYDMPAPGRHIKNGRPTKNIFFSPSLPADHKWSASRVAPFEHNARPVFRSIKAGRAISHAQPSPRSAVQRKILPKDVGMLRVPIRDRVLRSRERDAQ